MVGASLMKKFSISSESLLAIAGLTLATIAMPATAEATILVNLSIDNTNLGDPNIRVADICPEFACQPESLFFGNNVNNPTTNLVNNTQFAITGFTLTLLDGQDAVFDRLSSAIFPNFSLSSDRKEAVFTGGILNVNQATTFIIDSGANPVIFSAKFAGVPVPEPNSALEIVLFGVSSALALWKSRAN